MYDEESSSGKEDSREKKGTYLTVVLLPHNSSKDRQHRYTVCTCVCPHVQHKPKLLWEYITHSIKHGTMVQDRSNMLEMQLKNIVSIIHIRWVLMTWIDGILKNLIGCYDGNWPSAFSFLILLPFGVFFPSLLPSVSLSTVPQWRCKLSVLNC